MVFTGAGYAAMAEYTLYYLERGNASMRIENFAALSDGDAVIIAKAMQKHSASELWEANRFVRAIPASGAARPGSTTA